MRGAILALISSSLDDLRYCVEGTEINSISPRFRSTSARSTSCISRIRSKLHLSVDLNSLRAGVLFKCNTSSGLFGSKNSCTLRCDDKFKGRGSESSIEIQKSYI